MTSLLLLIIYLAFISLGLPDALLGSAWPVMHQELGASVSWAGIVSMIISGGTIVSSLASDRLTRKLGAGRVTAFSVLMTAAALFGFSVSHSFWMLCLWAIPYGLGAGSVDAALNNFVALHYPARHMSWLHCMWGVGASIGPVIMGWAITGGFRWNGGYQAIAGMQIVLTLVLFLSLPLWKKMPSPFARTAAQTGHNASADVHAEDSAGAKTGAVVPEDPGEPVPQEPPTLSQILRKKGVREVLVSFFCYCAIETTAGMWASSYCTLSRGISAEQAAQWASLFYIGITAGRFVCGFITMKLSDRNMIRLGQILAALGLILAMLPLGDYLKSEIREIDESLGFHEKGQSESQDFYGGDYSELLNAEDRTGDIVFEDGRVLGYHKGYWHYTMGQRKGLGVAYSEPLYVIDIDPERNRVVVGTEESTHSTIIHCRNAVYGASEDFDPGKVYQVKVRSMAPGLDATAEKTADGFDVRLKTFAKGAAPGQSAVVYDGDAVIASGVIEFATR